jgi:hypothetical protein
LFGGVTVPGTGCGAASRCRGGGWLNDRVFLIWGPNPAEMGSRRLQALDLTSCLRRGSSLASKLDIFVRIFLLSRIHFYFISLSRQKNVKYAHQLSILTSVIGAIKKAFFHFFDVDAPAKKARVF